mgnify:FL=1
MRTLSLLTAALLALPLLGHAADAETKAKAKAKPASAAKSQPAAKSKPATAKVASTSRDLSSRERLHSAAGQVASGVRAAEQALTPGELAVAERVHTGHLPCELGAHVQLSADAGRPGHFTLQHKGSTYHMTPVETTTGAVRLEDPRGGAVWLQVANKSMLMNQKIGQRLADDCKSEEQTRVAEAMKHAPPPSLLSGTPAGSVKP